MSLDDILENEKKVWTRSTPAELFYVRDETDMKLIRATPKLIELCERFNEELLTRAQKVNAVKPKYEPPPRKNRARLCKHKSEYLFFCCFTLFYAIYCLSIVFFLYFISAEVSSSDSSEGETTDEEDWTMEELQRKQQHPDRLHPEMW